MSNTHTLTRHSDIQSWVSDRKGIPAIARIRNRFGEEKSKLLLRFVRSQGLGVDDGMSPCSWTAWFAELDRQQLALKITPTGECELVPRAALN
ncbi:hypothetical protein DevBK_13090 [Devosia sp. BK]|jgi:hypothetical protein|uniref:hypothetical protein n=1 Tax=unclassified Devosia TaxID=196773 RepID=UPI0009E73A67|nr:MULTISPECIES: hypothetical protein [unclassified Devosia]MDV3252269.1 hypothetical protein [Devosia sp. BK]